jgi:hypothetical protein
VKASVDFATKSPEPPASLAKELEFPEKPVKKNDGRCLTVSFCVEDYAEFVCLLAAENS